MNGKEAAAAMHGSLGRAGALEAIRKNIASRGFHTYVITGAKIPNYTYTIGLAQALGSEIVLAGAGSIRARSIAEDVIVDDLIADDSIVAGLIVADLIVENLVAEDMLF